MISSFGAGGAELLVRDLATALSTAEFEIQVWGMNPYSCGQSQTQKEHDYEQSFRQSLEDCGIVTHIINPDGGKGTLSRIRAIAKIVAKENPNLIHCHSEICTIYTASALFLKKIPIIQTIHSSHIGYSKHLRLVSHRISRFITISNAVKHAFVSSTGTPETRTLLIYNAIDLERFRYQHPNTPNILKGGHKILVVGRLSEAKNHESLLYAWATVQPEIEKLTSCPATLFLAGTGELESQLKLLSNSLGISKSVVFLGLCDNIPRLLSEADLFILPSKWEGSPLSLVEAAANGIPIVTSNLPVAAELLDGIDNKIIADGNDRKSLEIALVNSVTLKREPLNIEKLSRFSMTNFSEMHQILYNGYAICKGANS